MARKPPPETPPILFEAALTPTGNCFAITADGDARLALSVSAAAAKPLAEAMAAGRLQSRTFIVQITVP
ncbi:MAG: hypothetical protein ACRDHF_13350 [Tepidiformaceae bacterium]